MLVSTNVSGYTRDNVCGEGWRERERARGYASSQARLQLSYTAGREIPSTVPGSTEDCKLVPDFETLAPGLAGGGGRGW